jgi:hypothetical protein
MVLELVSSSDPRALLLRDHVLPRIRADGSLEIQDSDLRLVRLRLGQFECSHWTPFRDLGNEEASSPAYRHAIERQHGTADLGYGLTISRDGIDLLTLLWAEDGRFAVVTFLPGDWEAEFRAL